MQWVAIIVSLVTAGVALFTAYQGHKSKLRSEAAEARAKEIGQQKVDQEAYREAQETYRNTIKELVDGNKRLQSEVKSLRQMAEDDRANLVEQLEKAHEERAVMERYLRGRIAKLEAALRDSGIPIPNGDLPGST